MLWFLTDPSRLATERTELDRLSDSASWLTGVQWTLERGLHVDAVISVKALRVELRLTYPDLFPAVPPEVRPQNPELRLTDHQYASGLLCLEWGPDNWQPSVTGAQMLESAYRLLKSEALAESEVPSRHNLSQGQTLRGKSFRVFVSDASEVALADLAELAYSLDFYDDAALVTIQRVGAFENEALPSGLRVAAEWQKKGLVLVGAPVALAKIRAVNEFRVAIAAWRGEVPAEADGAHAYLIRDVAGDLHFLLVSILDPAKLMPVSVVRSRTSAFRMPFAEDALASKRVGIVGLGSVGSKVAVSLARAGVTEFYLVDDDIFLPENLCRNELSWRHVARHKVDAVADEIRWVRPEAKVDTSCLCLTGQESNAAVNGTLRRLGKCDILVDATANPRVFNLLAACATTFDRSLAWLEVFAGGIGGLVARSRRGEGNPQTLRAAFNSFTEENPAPMLHATDYRAFDARGTVMTATDADVGVIAAHACRMILDELIGREPSQFPYPLYLIGLERSWIFSAPFHVVPLEVPTAVIPAPAVDEQAVKEAIAFVAQLIGETDEDTPPT